MKSLVSLLNCLKRVVLVSLSLKHKLLLSCFKILLFTDENDGPDIIQNSIKTFI